MPRPFWYGFWTFPELEFSPALRTEKIAIIDVKCGKRMGELKSLFSPLFADLRLYKEREGGEEGGGRKREGMGREKERVEERKIRKY